jgi:hypothetical protein
MKILGTGLAAIIITLAIAVLGQNNNLTKKPEQSILSRKITLPESRDIESTLLFQMALSNAKIPGGIVTVNCGNPSKQSFVASETTSLELFLINLELTDVRYKWQLNEGILNLLPKQELPKLLETPIEKFSVQEVTAQEALNLLQEKSEVKRKKIELGLDKASISINKASALNLESEQNSDVTFSLNLKGVTYRQILNEIVKAQGRMTWIYTEKHCGNVNMFSVILVE